MSMTHYMELLVANQPWNLIIFMAIPVILAEVIAITELYILFERPTGGWIRTVNRTAGLIAGPYFLGVFVYLFMTAVVPITALGAWRGPADLIAVGFYLAGIIPLAGISLVEVGFLGSGRDERGRLKLHATFVALFLVVAHVAMIAGMVNPQVFAEHVKVVAPLHEGMLFEK